MKRAITFFVFIVLFLVLIPSIAAQECECTNCPVPIYNNNISYAKLNTTVNGPNDLSECPLQQVCFEISHTWIGDLSASLVSPDGTQYLIMADINNDTLGCGNQFNNINVCVNVGTDNPLTNNTEYICDGPQWACLNGQDYTVPCGGVTDPRAGGIQAPNCDLNDFNTPGAPANGQWTLVVSDICPWDIGFIETFTLEFECGVACYACEADGGSFSPINIDACEGDDELIISPSPEWEGTQPNPLEYGYTFLISQNDTIIEVNDNPDLTTFSNGYYNVCGLSYYLLEEMNLPTLVGSSLSDLLVSTPFCADLSSTCAEINIISTQEATLVEMSKCANDCVDYQGVQYCDANTYDLNIPNQFGCDSLIQLIITDYITSEIVEVSTFKCASDCVDYEGTNYCESGTFDITYQNQNGCDSVVVLTVIDYEEIEISQETILICEGACGSFDDVEYCNAGTFDLSYQNEQGCDSLVQLTVALFDEVEPSQETLLLCEGVCASFDDVEYCNTGVFDLTYQNEQGCDSLVQLSVVLFDDVEPSQEILLICEGDCGSFNNVEYCETGTFDLIYQNQNGCDSLVQLTISNYDVDEITEINLNTCIGECATYDNVEYCETGTFDLIYQNQNGCDSLVQLTISNYDVDEITEINLNTCIGECATYDNVEYCETGTFDLIYQNQNGCDSLVQLTISNYDVDEITEINLNTCIGECATYDNVEYCETGTFDLIYQNQNGCDSLVQLTISNYDVDEITEINLNTCIGECATYDNVEYCETGTFDLIYQNQNGCDSLVQLTISNYDVDEITEINLNTCIGECATYDNVEYCETGTFDLIYQNQNGCDSLIQLTISNYDVDEITEINLNTCIGECATYDNVEYCETGTFDLIYQNQNGCDSLVQLTVSNYDVDEVTEVNLNVCIGECATYNNIEYCTPGSFDIILENQNGCDSLVQLNFDYFQEVSATPVNLVICQNDCIDYEGIEYCEAGNFEITLENEAGCDSLVNLNIEINIPNVIIATPDAITCNNQVITLDGSASEGDGFIWTNEAGQEIGDTPIINVNAAGCYTLMVTNSENGQACQNSALVCVSDNSQPASPTQISAEEFVCIGEEITYSTPIDPNAESYQWNIPENAQIVAGVNTNEISLVWLDSTGGDICVAAINGCGAGEIDCITTIVNPLPEGEFAGDVSSCDGEATYLQLSFSGLPPFTVTINNELLENLPSEYEYEVNPQNTTSYTLSHISDANGCSMESNEVAIVTVHQTPITETIPPISICNTNGTGDVNLINFDLLINNSMDGEWVDTDGSNATGSFPNLNFFDVTPGTYTFTFTTANAIFPCENVSTSVEVTVENCSCPDGSFTETSLCNDAAIIDLTNLQTETSIGTWSIVSAPVGQNPATINGSIFNADGADSGEYSILFTLTEIPPIGCPNTWSSSIFVSQVLSSGINNAALEFCADEASIVNLFDEISNEDLGGTWAETSTILSLNNAFNTDNATFNIEGQNAGTYLFTYSQETEAPCPSNSTTVTVIIHPMPVANAGTDQMLTCDEPNANLGANDTTQGAGITYVWGLYDNIVSNEPFLESTDAGLYILTVTNEFGCVAKDTVLIESIEGIPVADITVFPVSCYDEEDGAIIVNEINGGQEPYLISLDGENFNTEMDFVDLSPDTYTLLIEDANGCQNEIIFNIEQPQESQLEILATVTGENENTIVLGDSISLYAITNVDEENITSIIWSPSQYLNCDTCMAVMATPIETTTFTVTIENNACEEITTSLTVVVQKGYEIFVPNIFSPDGDGTNDIINIFAPDNVVQVNAFRIFSRWGTNLFERTNFEPNDPEHGWDGTYKGQEMNNGVYVWYAEVEYLDGEIIIYKGDITLAK